MLGVKLLIELLVESGIALEHSLKKKRRVCYGLHSVSSVFRDITTPTTLIISSDWSASFLARKASIWEDTAEKKINHIETKTKSACIINYLRGKRIRTRSRIGDWYSAGKLNSRRFRRIWWTLYIVKWSWQPLGHRRRHGSIDGFGLKVALARSEVLTLFFRLQKSK